MLTQKILDLPRSAKKLLMLTTDLIVLPLVFWLSLCLAKNEFVTSFTNHQIFSLIITTAVSMLVFMRLGLYRAVVRYMGSEALAAAFKGVTISSAIFLITVTFIAHKTPHTAAFFYWFLSFLSVLSTRFIVKQIIDYREVSTKQRVIIYGAGKTGYQLLSALNHGADLQVVALVDDNVNLAGTILHGVQIFQPNELEKLRIKYDATQVLLAIPSAPSWRRKEILEHLDALGLRVRTVPKMQELISGSSSVNQLQDINIEDLLGRDAIPPNDDLLNECVKNKIVMVTGAGGSIGSELCRQIIKLSPKSIVLFEICEFMLYRIEHELNQLKSETNQTSVIALLGDVKDYEKLSSTISAFKVETIYHAAAYKHVPLVEHNIIEGVRNNVFGTLNCAKAAEKNGVKTFVLISTDKAVRPTNIMGASKRLAEMILQAHSAQKSNTKFCMVRFGNVLGSSGSVVPLFCEQIRKGGPVTVTHEDIIRYFMTIPEAALLVIQAGTMASGGDVFLLDMGQPVKIADLAKKLIRLSGLTPKDASNPTGDIEIQYTGLRPGEKLYEELLIDRAAELTPHERILRAEENFLPMNKLVPLLNEMDAACKEMDCRRLFELFLACPIGYTPTSDISDSLWNEERKLVNKEKLSSIATFPKSRTAKSM